MSPNNLHKNVADILLVLSTLILITTKNAYAYIDPGSGSYLFQIIAAGFLSSIFIIKKFWRNISKFVSSFLKTIGGKKNG